MRDPKRIELVLNKLNEFWQYVPDWRFGQLVCNLQKMRENDLFYMEDEELIHFLDGLINKF